MTSYAIKTNRLRRGLQILILALVAILIYDGFTGSVIASKNLAGLLGWVHFRGLLILALLAVGNLFCMGCPMMATRNILRRFVKPRWEWPVALRRKWIALGLLIFFLYAYEAFSLWESPALTAAIGLGYFAAAWLVDGLFKGASFCKYVCPIGQFNFLASQNSPSVVAIRDAKTCASCPTLDCIRGRYEEKKLVQIGCERGLFLPHKVGNLDCTFCMDCVMACPSDNIRLSARLPSAELWVDPRRSGIGRLSRRWDIGCLASVFTFGALLNAFGMVSPVYALQTRLGEWGLEARWLQIGLIHGVGLIVIPFLLIFVTGLSSRAAPQETLPLAMQRVALSLIPLGFGIWAAHYLFHFLTGALTLVPVAQYVMREHGISIFGMPRWDWMGMPVHLVMPLEYGFVFLGLIGTVIVSLRLRPRVQPGDWRSFPPVLLASLLFAVALWLLNQPMEMRGTLLG